jgi:hypothetical protein
VTEIRFKWSEAKSLVSVWFTAILLSVISLITSFGVVATRRSDWNCGDNGHGFSARVEARNADATTIANITSQFLEENAAWKIRAFEEARETRYICDVCEYCGEVINVRSLSEDPRGF